MTLYVSSILRQIVPYNAIFVLYQARTKPLAAEIQRRVQEHNSAVDKAHRIPIRFSIHFGETLADDDGRRYGDAVNMTFRVEKLETETLSNATDGPFPVQNYLLVTEQVARELASTQGVKCNELGTFELNGFTGLHRIYQLRMADD